MEQARSLTRRWVALAAVATALVPASAAAAAAPWSEPQVLAGGHLAYWEPVRFPGAPPNSAFALNGVPGLLGFTPGGSGIAIVATDSGGRGLAGFSGSTGSFGAVRASTFGGVVPSLMALYGREGVMVAGAAHAKSDAVDKRTGMPLDAAVARGTLSGTFTNHELLAHGVGPIVRRGVITGDPAAAVVVALATNPAGNAAAVVSVPVKGRVHVAGYRSRLLIRRRGESTFRRVADIGPLTPGRSDAALALNGPGDVLVAWDDRENVRARVVTAQGRIGREQRLGQGGSAWIGGHRMTASIDATRRMLVAWVAQRVGEGSYAGSPGIVAFAYAPPYGGFQPAQVVQRNLPKGMDRAIGAPGVLTSLLRDRGVVAWNGYVDGRLAVLGADVRSGKASTPLELSPAGTDARLAGLAAGPRGGVVLNWWSMAQPGTAPDPPAGVYARARAAGTTDWSPLEPIVTTGPSVYPGVAAPLAVDPVSGHVAMLWSDLPVGPTVASPVPAPVPARYSVRVNPDG